MRVVTETDERLERHVSGRLEVTTRGQAFIDVTPAVTSWLREIGVRDGVLCAFVRHTTASLVVQENADPDVKDDLVDALGRIAPAQAPYRHSQEGVDDMPGHIKAMVCGPSVTIPVANGSALFGTWQSLYLVEHRASQRRREITLSYVGR